LFGHCLVKINSSYAFLAGGQLPGNRGSEAAYLFSETKGFVRQADMSTTRMSHSCGLIAGGLIIVAGGRIKNHDEALNSTEIFNLSTSTWETGPALPLATSAAAMISDNAGTFLIGGSTKGNWDKTIHKLVGSENSSLSWLEVGEMSKGRSYFSGTKLNLTDAECEGWRQNVL
jgi:hypothetical protein